MYLGHQQPITYIIFSQRPKKIRTCSGCPLSYPQWSRFPQDIDQIVHCDNLRLHPHLADQVVACPVGLSQPEYVSCVLSGSRGDILLKAFGTFRSLPAKVSGSSSFPSRISTMFATAWAASFSSLSSSSSRCIKSWDSDKSFSCWRAVAMSLSESALIFLSFSISSAFRYLRIFRSSTSFPQSLMILRMLCTRLKERLINTRQNKLVDCSIQSRD